MIKLDMTTVQALAQQLRTFALSKPLKVKVGGKVMKAATLDEDKDGNLVLTLKAK